MPVRPARPDELPAVDYRPIATREAEALGLPINLVHQLIDRESKWNPTARSPKGALGLMQLMPETAKGLGVDPNDPVQNLQGGMKYLRQLVDQYQGDTTKALAAYNAGPSAVDRYQGVPPYAETQAYVQAVGQGQPTTLPTSPRGGRIRPATPEEQTAPAGRLRPPSSPGKIGPGPSASTRFSRVATPLLGAIAGGMRGAAMGSPLGPLGTFAGGVAGAGLGAGGAEALQAGWEYLTSDAPPTPSGIARRVGSAAETGAVGEATGRGLAPVIGAVTRPLMRPMASKLEPYAEEALSTFRRPGAPPQVLPSEISSSRGLNVAENIAEGSLLGGGRISGVKQARQNIAEEKVLGVLDQLGPRTGTKDAGRSVVEARRQAIQQFRGEEKVAWGQYEEQAKTLPIQTPRLDAFIAEQIPREAGTIIPNAGMTAAQRVASLTGSADEPLAVMYGGREVDFRALPQTVQQAVISSGNAPPMPTPLSAAQFQKTVSNLGTLVRRLETAARMDPTKNADLGLAKRLYGLAQQDLDDVLKAADPEGTGVHAAYETARTVSRLGNQRLFNEELRKIAKAAPEKVVGRLFKRDNSTAIEAVRRAVDPETFAQVQSSAIQRIIRPNPRTDRINWGSVAQRIDSLGDDSLSALFPGNHAKEIRNVAKLMQELGRPPASGLGKVGIQLTQWGAFAGLATGSLSGPSAAIILTPAIMARVFTNPRALKWLSTGLRGPKGNTEAVTAMTQLAAFLGRDVEEPPARAVGPGPRAQSGPPPQPSGR